MACLHQWKHFVVILERTEKFLWIGPFQKPIEGLLGLELLIVKKNSTVDSNLNPELHGLEPNVSGY